MLDRVGGHFWTIAPNLWFPPPAPGSTPWSTVVHDPRMGAVTLRGQWSAPPRVDTALVIVHGLGGTEDRHYCRRAARVATARGWACLRLALRGADRQGEDFHHAGLVADVAAAVASQQLQQARRIFLLGYSLGGHLVLRAAASEMPANVRAVAAICAPVNLDQGATHLDARPATLYRRMILAKLRDIYRPFAAHHPDWPDPTTLSDIDSIRTWDSRTVVPRFGFDNVAHYYQSESASNHLDQLVLPALGIWSTQDPMVHWPHVEPHLSQANHHLTIQPIQAGGHVAFPPTHQVETRAMNWLDAH